ncbi:MAG: hypothetical protein QOJ51_6801 [Acidobacteriaceae bacterium]|nr:hypothetical protein [Acidobacteriaceae bacterium]MDX6458461.1 hypothetical protein [Acidobacteriaceae bacterium]MEA2263976.1 hypothetical protein [Acidobacteriaceae bacterium]
MVHGETEEAIHAVLWEAVRAGLIFQQESTYKFLRDRIQQAAYSLIPEEHRAQVHLRVGRALLVSMTATSSPSIFSMSRTSSIEAPHCWSTGTRKCRWRRSICAPGEKPRRPRPMRRRASWSSRYELTLWSARQQAHELSDKLRACQGDDTMTVSRHRHVVTQHLWDIRKS